MMTYKQKQQRQKQAYNLPQWDNLPTLSPSVQAQLRRNEVRII